MIDYKYLNIFYFSISTNSSLLILSIIHHNENAISGRSSWLIVACDDRIQCTSGLSGDWRHLPQFTFGLDVVEYPGDARGSWLVCIY